MFKKKLAALVSVLGITASILFSISALSANAATTSSLLSDRFTAFNNGNGKGSGATCDGSNNSSQCQNTSRN
ncbi:hypothetical protein FJ444_04695 [Aestuariibacter sp. GS-14]|uniref:hypothetical protein n=1 Tax=Aestuariibacter sp. GS-14 TaxID=2590670 RepID=UPI001125F5A3|nr:hypothetical protein [Aestuariibacter sp. GS-14]TPV60924.1 hypothetical protein FJ444_04695 [Aestuariibacter sp. GS-14]